MDLSETKWNEWGEYLENCYDLKCSDSVSLACDMIELYKYIIPKIFGGCCGTDNTHLEEVAKMIIKQVENNENL